jgi:membrane protease YdiL (CAAX protease family)
MTPVPPPFAQAIALVAATAFPLAGLLLLARRAWRWQSGAAPLLPPQALARLQQRAWHPADAALLLSALLLPMLCALLMSRSGAPPAAPASPRPPAVVPYLLYYVLVLAGVALAARRTGVGIGKALGLQRETAAAAAWRGLELGLATLPLVMGVALATDWALRQAGVTPPRQPIFDVLADPGLPTVVRGLLLLIAVAVAPLTEEAIFRGVLLPAALQRWRPAAAILLVNIVFALLHLHAPSFPPLLAVGLCFSAGMLATGSLLTPVVMHAVFNAEMLLAFFALPALRT